MSEVSLLYYETKNDKFDICLFLFRDDGILRVANLSPSKAKDGGRSALRWYLKHKHELTDFRTEGYLKLLLAEGRGRQNGMSEELQEEIRVHMSLNSL